MVKNKKMSKTSIAVIVLALLLVLSLVMGMTGAWFTDKDSNTSSSLNFGTINVTVTETEFGVYRDSAVLSGDVMPGDHIKVDLGVAKATPASDEDFYWVVKITATINSVEVGASDGANAWIGKTATTAFLHSEAPADGIDIELDPEVYGNTYQGQPVVVGYEVRAIQAANLNATSAYTLLTGNSLDWSTDVGGHNSTGLPTA